MLIIISMSLNYSCDNVQGGPGKQLVVEVLPGSGIADDDPLNDFSPHDLKIKAGTKVTWINKDNKIHFVDVKGHYFSSPMLLTGDKYTFIFNNRGEYQYYCGAHRWMRGKIKVW